MTTKTDICNFALGRVAEARISSIDEANEPARLCKLHLEQTVREILRRANWRSCRKRAALTESSTPPAFGWARAYPLPVDCLRIVSFNNQDPQIVERTLFEVEGRVLMTNEAVAKIVYVQDITQETGNSGYGRMDPLLVKAVTTALAAKLAWPLQQSRTLQESLIDEAEADIRRANSASARDAFEPLVSQQNGSRWFTSRF